MMLNIEKVKWLLQDQQFNLKVAAIGMTVLTLAAIGIGNAHTIQDVLAFAHRR